jgi:phosphoribosylanthranilate isomerase
MTKRTKIKICGNTNEEDVSKLSQMGIDALGFIVIISARRRPFKITLKRASKIITQLSPFITTVVGVHRKYNSLEEIIDILRETNPDAVQLQFGGTSEEIEKLKLEFPRLKIIKRFSLTGREELEEIKKFLKIVNMILIDSRGVKEALPQNKYWQLAKMAVKVSSKPVMLAGGLDSKNVDQAIKIVRPYAVDLISGVRNNPWQERP